MTAGIMQPYFFPYVGYFSLISYSDEFVFFDTPQYIHHGWVNRNRILSISGEPTYIIVPTKKIEREQSIKETSIADSKWIERLWGQLSVYKRKAPYYCDTMEFLHFILDNYNTDSISDLNIYTVKSVCEKIGIDAKFKVFSEMNTGIQKVGAPDEWALEICKYMHADVYVNPPGGQSFFDKNKYINAEIDLRFLQSNLRPYVQRIGKYVSGLSIIDVMMFCNNVEIKDIIEDYTII